MDIPIDSLENSSGIIFSYKYIASLCRIDWTDVAFAIKSGYLEVSAFFDHALALLEEDSPPGLFELASMAVFRDRSDEYVATSQIDKIIDASKKEWIAAARDKTAYAALSWLRENCEKADCDPADVIEHVYADLWYPEELACLIQWMPCPSCSQAHLLADDWDLDAQWDRYLKNAASRYGGERQQGRGNRE